MQTTFATPAVYKKGIVFPRFKPKSPPKDVVVVYIGVKNGEEKNGVKTRVQKARDERSKLSPSARAFIDARLEKAMQEVREGKGIGPFSTAEEAIKALRL